MDYTEAYGEGKYLRSMDIVDQPMTTVILSVARETVVNPIAGTSDQLPVAQLYGSQPMILNKTNYKAVTSIAGSSNTDNWIGKVITIAAVPYKRSDSGFALRIKKKPEDFKALLEYAGSLEDFKARYEFIKGKINIEIVKKIAQKWKVN